MKRLSNIPKKAIIVTVCMVVVIAAVSVIAVKSTLITKAEAKAVALRDTGLSEAEASALYARLEFDDGRFQYEVDFYSNGTEYEYLIQAKDGEIIARDIDGSQPDTDRNSTATSQENSLDEANPVVNAANNSGNNYIGVDLAKEIALNHANLNESDVRFAKEEFENDDGRTEYEIEFYSGQTEYDYTIDAVSGNIIEYDVDYD